MDASKFEKICREAQIKPVAKVSGAHGSILVGEKVRDTDYEVLWAIERGDMQISGIVTVPKWRDVLGHPVQVRADERINAATLAAKQFIGDAVSVGLYA